MIKNSVIVPTYNRSSLLAGCLNALAKQTVHAENYEIIVVNDGSKDDTDEVIKKFRETNPSLNFIYLKQKNGGPAKARNAGIKAAKGEIIFFTDDDCVVPPEWMETLLDAYRRYPDIAGVGGWYRYAEDNLELQNNIIVQYRNYLFHREFEGNAMKEIKIVRISKIIAGNTANMSYLKSALEKVGGFDETFDALGLEDFELAKQVVDSGSPLLYMPYFVEDKKLPTWNMILKRWFHFGRSRYLFSKKYPNLRSRYEPNFQKNVINQAKGITWLFSQNFVIIFLHFLFSRAGWDYQTFKEKLML